MVIAIDDEAADRPDPPVQRARSAAATSSARASRRRWSASCTCWGSPAWPTCSRPSSSPSITSWASRTWCLTVLTDSMEMYQSRLLELTAERGEFAEADAAAAFHRYLLGQTTDNLEELTLPGAPADPQPQVLYLGRAAGEDLRRNPGSVVRRDLLERHSGPGGAARCPDHGVQRPHRSAQGTLGVGADPLSRRRRDDRARFLLSLRITSHIEKKILSRPG